MKSALYTAVIVLASATSVLAGLEVGPVQVPEPTTIALLSASAAGVTLGARWFRRK